MIRDAEQLVAEAVKRAWTPEQRVNLADWSERFRTLNSKTSAEGVPYSLDRVPYLRGIMDALSTAHPCQRIVFMKGAQIGATEAANCWLGYVIHTAPGPFLYVTASLGDAKEESKTRLQPMIDSTPVLRDLVAEPRSRDSGNTILLKEFPGGSFFMVGANSARGFRRRACRYFFGDEIDAWPADVGGDVRGEGNPIKLAEQRTATFARNRKIFLVSTPGVEGLSHIEPEFQRSDQRRYFVPCPHCGHRDWIRWHNIRWEEGHPETAALNCEACSQMIPEHHKTTMLNQGSWVPTAPGDGITMGFHLSSLYSPLGWKSWAEVIKDFLDAKDDPSKLKTWTNTTLGETWKLRGTTIEPSGLLARRERYAEEVPAGVLVLVASVDTQGDRLEVLVKGYGAGEESWLIAYEQLDGDPSMDDVWFALDRFRAQPFDCGNGVVKYIALTGIDSGGKKGHTDRVYQYCSSRRGVVALKGTGLQGLPLIAKKARARNQYGVMVLPLCVDTGKTIIYERLKITTPGPACLHWPEWLDSKYFDGLVSEKPVIRYVRGKPPQKEWVKLRDRNEPLDLENYALATLYSLGEPKLKALGIRTIRRRPDPAGGADQAPESLTDPTPAGDASQPPRPAARKPAVRRSSGWVTGWKGGGGRGWGRF